MVVYSTTAPLAKFQNTRGVIAIYEHETAGNKDLNRPILDSHPGAGTTTVVVSSGVRTSVCLDFPSYRANPLRITCPP